MSQSENIEVIKRRISEIYEETNSIKKQLDYEKKRLERLGEKQLDENRIERLRYKLRYFQEVGIAPEEFYETYSMEKHILGWDYDDTCDFVGFLLDYANPQNFKIKNLIIEESEEHLNESTMIRRIDGLFKLGNQFMDFTFDEESGPSMCIRDSLTPQEEQYFIENSEEGYNNGSLKQIDLDYLFDIYKKVGLEQILTSADVVGQWENFNKRLWLERYLGSIVLRMEEYDQKNSHHCYDLMQHTLRAVEAIKKDDLTEEEFTKLRVATFLHDIAKPDVASYNEKTGQQVYYGHAARSAKLAKPILDEFGYSEDEIAEICFYIEHHDDFISYKTNMQPWMENHEYVRKITPDTVSEVIIRNKYDFKAMGYDEHQTKYICYTLGHNGEEPNFMLNGEPLKIDVNMDEARAKIESGEYNSSFIPTARNYEMLLRLCEADALAQSEVAMQNGQQVGSRKEKVENVKNIQAASVEAFHSVSEKVAEYSDDFIQKILLLATKRVASREKSEKAQALLKDFEKIRKQRDKDNDSIGE